MEQDKNTKIIDKNLIKSNVESINAEVDNSDTLIISREETAIKDSDFADTDESEKIPSPTIQINKGDKLIEKETISFDRTNEKNKENLENEGDEELKTDYIKAKPYDKIKEMSIVFFNKFYLVKKIKLEKQKKEKAKQKRQQETEKLKKIEDVQWKPVNRKGKKHKKSYFFQIVIGIFIAIVLCLALMASPLFKIKNIKVEGNQYYTEAEVINISGASKGNNLWFKAKKKDIKKKLLKDPYFTDVKIKREIPNTLKIIVAERRQSAAIKYGDKFVVVDDTGLVLRVTNIDPKLTILEGLTLTKMNVGSKVAAKEKDRLKKAIDILSYITKGDLYFKEIIIDDNNVTGYLYDTLRVVGTSEQMKKAIKSGTLKKVINKLFQNKTRRGTINLGEENYISFYPIF